MALWLEAAPRSSAGWYSVAMDVAYGTVDRATRCIGYTLSQWTRCRDGHIDGVVAGTITSIRQRCQRCAELRGSPEKDTDSCCHGDKKTACHEDNTAVAKTRITDSCRHGDKQADCHGDDTCLLSRRQELLIIIMDELSSMCSCSQRSHRHSGRDVVHKELTVTLDVLFVVHGERTVTVGVKWLD